MKNFGTLEYALDKYSKTWTWKITGPRAVNMISRLVPEAWYGESSDEVIVPDNTDSVKHIKWIADRYPLEVLSKSAWQRKIVRRFAVKEEPSPKVIHKLEKAKVGEQFKGKLLNFQKEGLDFLIKSSGNALLADEMGLGKCIAGSSVVDTTVGKVRIDKLWEQSEATEENDECWAKLLVPLEVFTFDGFRMTTRKVEQIFRQKINEKIIKIFLSDGTIIECTSRHRFLTKDGWKHSANITCDDKIAKPCYDLGENLTDIYNDCLGWDQSHHNMSEQEVVDRNVGSMVLFQNSKTVYEKSERIPVIWATIHKVECINFDGYVYDLSVPQTHNYVANGLISHNTVQTLAYLATEKQALPTLVVAPLVTLNNWQREIQKFLKKKSRNGRLVDSGHPSSTIIRTGKREELGKFDFYIINYELLHKRMKDLSKLGIKAIVCDEVHNLRSKTTQKYKAVKKLAALPSITYRVGLSGTPIYNRGSEIWPIVDILKPGLLGSFKEFCEYFCYINEKGKAIVLERKRELLKKELQKHVMLRRRKSDVLKELKDKVRYKEVIDSDTSYYYGELDKIWKKFEAEQRVAETAFDKSASYRRAIQSERQAAGIAKLPHVINFVRNIMEIEESVVVFCHHKAIHRLLHESLSEYFPVSIIGGQTDKSRQDQIDKFQAGDSKLMIAGLRAGNVGINLSTARYVIFAELDWSPAIHRQAEDRLHRIGQKNTVFAYYLIGNDTLDDHVANILVDKSYEIDAIIDDEIESFENKEKAELILAQIHDKVRTKLPS